MTSICRLFRRSRFSAKSCRRVLQSDNNFDRFQCPAADILDRGSGRRLAKTSVGSAPIESVHPLPRPDPGPASRHESASRDEKRPQRRALRPETRSAVTATRYLYLSSSGLDGECPQDGAGLGAAGAGLDAGFAGGLGAAQLGAEGAGAGFGAGAGLGAGAGFGAATGATGGFGASGLATAAAGAACFFAGRFLAAAFLAGFFGAAALDFLADFFADFLAFFTDFLADFWAAFLADFFEDFFAVFFFAVRSFFLFFLFFLSFLLFFPLAIVILLLPPINLYRSISIERLMSSAFSRGANRSIQSRAF
jgi:hypothetical protein